MGLNKKAVTVDAPGAAAPADLPPVTQTVSTGKPTVIPFGSVRQRREQASKEGLLATSDMRVPDELAKLAVEVIESGERATLDVKAVSIEERKARNRDAVYYVVKFTGDVDGKAVNSAMLLPDSLVDAKAGEPFTIEIVFRTVNGVADTATFALAE